MFFLCGIRFRYIFTKCHAQGEQNLMFDLREDSDEFFWYFRMSPQPFDVLLCLVAPKLTKKNANYCDAVKPGTRLIITLRYFFVHS